MDTVIMSNDPDESTKEENLNSNSQQDEWRNKEISRTKGDESQRIFVTRK